MLDNLVKFESHFAHRFIRQIISYEIFTCKEKHKNTNAVIAGHRGYNGASYFRYIDKLQPGDLVTVRNLWDTLNYRVSGIKIIDPHDVEEILIQDGRELLTLITCHPYASGGKQRYVVYCERVPDAL